MSYTIPEKNCMFEESSEGGIDVKVVYVVGAETNE
jgi:hypothetical protein